MQTPTTYPSDLDSFLIDALEEDILAVLLTPPLVPAFARETSRPGAAS